MKIRNGFVSNSSSSSFFVGIKGGVPARDKLLELFGVTPGSLADKLCGPTIEFLLSGHEIESMDDFAAQQGWDADEYKEVMAERQHPVIELMEAGYTVYEIRASNQDGNSVSAHLYSGGFDDIRTAELAIHRWG